MVKRQTPPRSGLFPIVSAWCAARPASRGTMSCLACPDAGASAPWLPQTHLAALSPGARRWPGALRAFAATEPPLCALVPSSANARLNVQRSPGRGRRGGGAAHGTQGRRTRYQQEQAEVSQHTSRAGSVPSTRLGVQRRRPACLGARVGSGVSPQGLGRRHACRRLSLRCASRWASHKPAWAVTGQHQRAPRDGRRWSMPGLASVCAPSSHGLVALPDAPGGRRRPRRSTPPCAAQGRWWCRRCQSVSPQRPWRTCPGGQRRRNPAPAGRGRAAGLRRAARGGGACPGRAPCAAETGAGRHGASRL